MKRTQVLSRALAAVIVATVGSGVCAATAAVPAGARGRPPATTISCGQTITESIRVANDLSCEGTTSAPALTVSGAGVTVDLNGHVVERTGTRAGLCLVVRRPLRDCGVMVSEGATLTNGTVGPTLGLVGGTARRINARSVSISDGTFDRGRITNGWVNGTRMTITRSHLLRSTIDFDDTFSSLTFSIRDNVIEDSNAGPVGQQRLRAAISISGAHTFLAEVNGEIVNNRIVGSAGAGILYYGGGPNFGNLLIADNDLRGNAGSGISVRARRWPVPLADEVGGPLTIRGNRSAGNGGYGIEVVAEAVDVVDGGRNVARGNALDPQCLGVVCRGEGRGGGRVG